VFAMAPDEQKERLPHTYQPPNWSRAALVLPPRLSADQPDEISVGSNPTAVGEQTGFNAEDGTSLYVLSPQHHTSVMDMGEGLSDGSTEGLGVGEGVGLLVSDGEGVLEGLAEWLGVGEGLPDWEKEAVFEGMAEGLGVGEKLLEADGEGLCEKIAEGVGEGLGGPEVLSENVAEGLWEIGEGLAVMSGGLSEGVLTLAVVTGNDDGEPENRGLEGGLTSGLGEGLGLTDVLLVAVGEERAPAAFAAPTPNPTSAVRERRRRHSKTSLAIQKLRTFLRPTARVTFMAMQFKRPGSHSPPLKPTFIASSGNAPEPPDPPVGLAGFVTLGLGGSAGCEDSGASSVRWSLTDWGSW